MQNKKIKRLAESFAILPILTLTFPLGGVIANRPNINENPPIVAFQKENISANSLFAFSQKVDEVANDRELKAELIDTYFKERNMPLEGYGMKMVLEAEKNGLDYRLIPAISVIETTGGKNLCKNPKAPNNPFGWGSCKIGFKSFDQAIETVARNLGGNNPNTDHHYEGKDVKGILEAYNPPSIVPDYASKVMKVMKTIGEEEVKEVKNS